MNSNHGTTRKISPRVYTPYLWDVDEQTGIWDIGDTDESLLDDPLSLNLHTGHRGAGCQEQQGWPCAGMLPDIVDLLWGRDRQTLSQATGLWSRVGFPPQELAPAVAWSCVPGHP